MTATANSEIPDLFVGDSPRQPSDRSDLNLGFVLDFLHTRKSYEPLQTVFLGRTLLNAGLDRIGLPSSNFGQNKVSFDQTAPNLIAFLAATMESCYEAVSALPKYPQALDRFEISQNLGDKTSSYARSLEYQAAMITCTNLRGSPDFRGFEFELILHQQSGSEPSSLEIHAS